MWTVSNRTLEILKCCVISMRGHVIGEAWREDLGGLGWPAQSSTLQLHHSTVSTFKLSYGCLCMYVDNILMHFASKLKFCNYFMILQGPSKIPFRTASYQRITYNTSQKPVWKDPWADTPFRESLKRAESAALPYLCSWPETEASVFGQAGCWLAWGCWMLGSESCLLGLAGSWHQW